MSQYNDSCPVELIDIYDSDKKRTGEIAPRRGYDGNGFRLVVQICIFSGDRLLIQKRTESKKSFPGYWDMSAAGQVDAGESGPEGARRETLEELGLDYDITEKDLFVTHCLPHVFNEVYILDYNGSDIRIQESEVDEYGWATFEEIVSMIKSGKFIPYKPELIGSIFEAHRTGARNVPDMHMETTYI